MRFQGADLPNLLGHGSSVDGIKHVVCVIQRNPEDA